MTPEEWLSHARYVEGSWWQAWLEWLSRHSSPLGSPPEMGALEAGLPPLETVPGNYVLMK